MKKLTPEQTIRYARHLTLPEVGVEGQLTLQKASVLLVGVGGLGSPVAMYLAASGVGHIGLVEYDVVDESNLQRQILYSSSQVGKAKIDMARLRLLEINPHIEIECFPEKLTTKNALSIFEGYDIVVDGSDNFTTRYLVNDAAYFSKIPLVSGAIMGFEGQLSVFNYQGSSCYRCLFPSPPPKEAAPNCSEAGVLGVLPGVIGTMQATECLKIILGIGEVSANKLILYDALAMSFQNLTMGRDPQCPLCSKGSVIKELTEVQNSCSLKAFKSPSEVDPDYLLSRLDEVTTLDVRENFERDICRIDSGLHIPLGQLENRVNEIPLEKEIVVYCKMGGRSLKALDVLKDAGVTNAKSLKGGIIGWADQVDPQIKKY
ncbi:MAG: molybdopterin-synthase adenylyltransferase MoeB [Bacteriovoracaceae bacterium]|jgi:sulfur-carrier protein adenylyltransferase/sulfurtransferase|nr:molybdopterin-synthase adenylyltransferase MoeB [Bacteriovoracaceae bacterium]